MSKRMTETQIVSILKEAEAGISAKELCRKYGVLARHFTNGSLNTAVWKRLTSND